jgi:hypothetical protein
MHQEKGEAVPKPSGQARRKPRRRRHRRRASGGNRLLVVLGVTVLAFVDM